MKYRITYYDSAADEYVNQEFLFYRQARNAYNALTHLPNVVDLELEKIDDYYAI